MDDLKDGLREATDLLRQIVDEIRMSRSEVNSLASRLSSHLDMWMARSDESSHRNAALQVEQAMRAEEILAHIQLALNELAVALARQPIPTPTPAVEDNFNAAVLDLIRPQLGRIIRDAATSEFGNQDVDWSAAFESDPDMGGKYLAVVVFVSALPEATARDQKQRFKQSVLQRLPQHIGARIVIEVRAQ